MGISVFPAPSTASAPFVGAGSVVASAFSDKGWYSTSLAAGKYIVVVNGTNGSSYQSYSVVQPLGNYYGYSSYENNFNGDSIPNNMPSLVNMTTTGTLVIGVSPYTDKNHFGGSAKYKYPTESGGNSYYRTYQCINSYNADLSTYTPITYQNYQNYTAAGRLPTRYQEGSPMAGDVVVTRNSGYTAGTQTSRDIFFNYIPKGGSIQFLGGTTMGLQTYDGAGTWTTVANTGTNLTWYDLCKGDGPAYVAVGTNTSSTQNIVSSTNGTTWSTRQSNISAALYTVGWGNDKYVAAGDNSITTSTDGITWTSRTSPASTNWIQYLYYGGYHLLLGTPQGSSDNNVPAIDESNAAVSTNGTTWTAVSITLSADAATTPSNKPMHHWRHTWDLRGRAWVGSDGFYVVNGYHIFRSTNGTDWLSIYQGFTSAQCNAFFYDSTRGSWRGLTFENSGRGLSFTYPSHANYTIYQSTIS